VYRNSHANKYKKNLAGKTTLKVILFFQITEENVPVKGDLQYVLQECNVQYLSICARWEGFGQPTCQEEWKKCKREEE
jgi:hypothetical protein